MLPLTMNNNTYDDDALNKGIHGVGNDKGVEFVTQRIHRPYDAAHNKERPGVY
jgi:hypothetical protein